MSRNRYLNERGRGVVEAFEKWICAEHGIDADKKQWTRDEMLDAFAAGLATGRHNHPSFANRENTFTEET